MDVIAMLIRAWDIRDPWRRRNKAALLTPPRKDFSCVPPGWDMRAPATTDQRAPSLANGTGPSTADPGPAGPGVGPGMQGPHHISSTPRSDHRTSPYTTHRHSVRHTHGIAAHSSL